MGKLKVNLNKNLGMIKNLTLRKIVKYLKMSGNCDRSDDTCSNNILVFYADTFAKSVNSPSNWNKYVT